MTGGVGFTVRAAALAFATLVLAHTLIFLAGYGATYGAAMAQTGHDHGWTIAVVTALTLGGAVLATAAWRLLHLRRLARDAGAHPLKVEPGASALLRRWLAWWLALTVAAAVLFVIQENLELHRVGAHLLGVGVLASPVYPGATAIIAAVALVVSLLASLLGWKLDLLIARIGAIRPDDRAAALPIIGRAAPIDRRLGSLLGRRLAGRAPPG